MGQVVKILREKNEFSREDMAKAIGVTTNYVYIFEAGERNLSFEAIWKLSEFFNIPAAYFFVLADETVSKDQNRSRETKQIVSAMRRTIEETLKLT
jgi:transcriptional regulator with XRE-family HTH domain